ncbi:MAG TPA: DUF4433 domain-containing protein [Candidatus Acidoferrales bacterium]|nr:DUF4433 domain-containing protein [Candidatus Acidoferrales bacterium]
MPIPRPLRIFHITAICNLASIAQAKKLHANTVLQKKKMQPGNIAYQGAQGKRAAKMVARPPGGVIHDYVPFYFAPRSPMLLTINKGNVPDCPYRQQDIVDFVTIVETLIANALPYVFYDCNATLDIATCYNDVKDMDKIDWDLFLENPQMDGYCKYWHNVVNKPRYVRRQETRQAEFLVHQSVPLKLMTMVGAYNKAKADEVSQIFDEAGIRLQVEAKPEWYF